MSFLNIGQCMKSKGSFTTSILDSIKRVYVTKVTGGVMTHVYYIM